MPTPYASVVLPTHDRAATLPCALASVQAQTMREIEILLVLDGASDACRRIARDAAADDPRVRVFDLPKAPGTEKVNVDHALGEASAPRIFYIDDDDLWLPGHVATLGPALDDADIADTRVASLGVLAPCLHLAACRPGGATSRAQLAAYVRKDLFDTHLAHRRTWLGGRAGRDPASTRPIWDLLAAFARDPQCRWRSLEPVTAISLHGAARRHLTHAARGREIVALAALLAQDAADPLGAMPADRLYYLFNLLATCPPGEVDFAGYAAQHGVYADLVVDRDCRLLYGLFQPPAPGWPDAARLLARMAALVVAGYRFGRLAPVLRAAYGAPGAARICALAAELPDAPRAAIAMVEALLAHPVDRPRGLAIARAAAAAGPDPVGEIAGWIGRATAA
jgi:glycosyltransferase involved in cell wall biosynthesis